MKDVGDVGHVGDVGDVRCRGPCDKIPKMRGKPSNTWLNQLETETQSRTRARADLPQLRVSGLTVLWHADPERVGEHVALPELTTGREAQLSRLTPLFAPMEGGEARPLAEPRLSRSPILLVPRPDGALVVDAQATRSPRSRTTPR